MIKVGDEIRYAGVNWIATSDIRDCNVCLGPCKSAVFRTVTSIRLNGTPYKLVFCENEIRLGNYITKISRKIKLK